MDRALTAGEYVQAGDGGTWLVIQHGGLAELPTVICLAATRTPLPHRSPLILWDDTNRWWIHTYAPAAVLRLAARPLGIQADSGLVDRAAAALTLCTAARLDTPARLLQPARPGTHVR